MEFQGQHPDFSATTSVQHTSVEDLYLSRNGLPARLSARLDPVVYAKEAAIPPIDMNMVRQYDEQGFLVLEEVFNDREVLSFQHELDRLKNNPTIKASELAITEPGNNNIRSIFQIHENNHLFQQLALDIRLAGLAKYLLDDQVYIHQSRLNYKSGFNGKEFYWHSDFETWHVEDGMPRMRALSMSIMLTENSHHNGPLMLVPGSHKTFLSCEKETPAEHFKSSLKKQEYGVPDQKTLFEMIRENGIVSVTCKPGSVVVFDCNTIHGSNSNITPFPRANIFFVYNAISNQVGAPFCNHPPRPEYICTRENIQPITVGTLSIPSSCSG